MRSSIVRIAGVFGLACSFALAACTQAKEIPAAPPAPAAPETQAAAPLTPAAPAPPTGGALHLGEPITETKIVALSDITKNPKQFEGNVVTTSGTVFAVCQSMGCWMEIKDDKNAE